MKPVCECGTSKTFCAVRRFFVCPKGSACEFQRTVDQTREAMKQDDAIAARQMDGLAKARRQIAGQGRLGTSVGVDIDRLLAQAFWSAGGRRSLA